MQTTSVYLSIMIRYWIQTIVERPNRAWDQFAICQLILYVCLWTGLIIKETHCPSIKSLRNNENDIL